MGYKNSLDSVLLYGKEGTFFRTFLIEARTFLHIWKILGFGVFTYVMGITYMDGEEGHESTPPS